MFVQTYTEARSRYHSCRRVAFHIMTVCLPQLSCSNAHAPYYSAIWPVRLYYIFPHYLINGTT